MVLGRLRMRHLWDGQADMNLDMRKARNMELRVITMDSGGWGTRLSEVIQEWKMGDAVVGWSKDALWRRVKGGRKRDL